MTDTVATQEDFQPSRWSLEEAEALVRACTGRRFGKRRLHAVRLRVDDGEWDWLRDLAQRDGRSISDFLRAAVLDRAAMLDRRDADQRAAAPTPAATAPASAPPPPPQAP
jgi:hypothetical protein